MSHYLKQIEQLVELQKVDDQIHAIRKDLTSAPKEIESLKAEFTALEEERTRVQDKLDHLKEQEKRINFEIEEEMNRIKRSKSKLMQVENNKEYQAVSREMDSLEKVNKDRKEELKILEDLLTSQIETSTELQEKYDSLKSDLEAKEANLAERTEKAQKELQGLDERRRETSKDIPMPVLSRYEFIRERLEYPVIVPVNAGICSGCHIAIPPQGFIELQKGKQILSCPNCQRLVFWSEHFCTEE